MEQHPNARLTPRGREALVSRIESGLGVAETARQMGVGRETASKWLRRSRSGEPMSDRSSRPRRLARPTPREVEDRVREARSSLPLTPPGLVPSASLEERCAAMGMTPEMRDAAALAAEALGEEDYENLA